MQKALFLDRDGTLNEDPGYLSDPEQVRLLPGVGDTLRFFKERGYLILVVSNQSGVARGKVSLDNLEQIHARINSFLQPHAVQVDAFSFCIHHPDVDCECRKPKPKLILDLAARFAIDLKQSLMVGDKISDVQCGINSGCGKSVLVLTGAGQSEQSKLGNLEPLPGSQIYCIPELKSICELI